MEKRERSSNANACILTSSHRGMSQWQPFKKQHTDSGKRRFQHVSSSQGEPTRLKYFPRISVRCRHQALAFSNLSSLSLWKLGAQHCNGGVGQSERQALGQPLTAATRSCGAFHEACSLFRGRKAWPKLELVSGPHTRRNRTRTERCDGPLLNDAGPPGPLRC